VITAVCPNNPKHTEFTTVVVISQEWVVNQHGEFHRNGRYLKADQRPSAQNKWTCDTCLSQAEVTESI
jgi:hypothetical protein